MHMKNLKSVSDEMNVSIKEMTVKNDINVDEATKLLTEWKLEQYAKTLYDNGYEQIDDWKDLTLDDLKRFCFKEGHAKKFSRKVEEYFENIQTEMEGISTTQKKSD